MQSTTFLGFFLLAFCASCNIVGATTSPSFEKNNLSDSEQNPSKRKTPPNLDIMTMDAEQRTAWPELVGLEGNQAKSQLEASLLPGKDIMIVPEDSMVTMDYRTDRIRIFVNKEGKVARPPALG